MAVLGIVVPVLLVDLARSGSTRLKNLHFCRRLSVVAAGGSRCSMASSLPRASGAAGLVWCGRCVTLVLLVSHTEQAAGVAEQPHTCDTGNTNTVTVAKRECEGQQSCSFLSFLSMEVLRLRYEFMYV
jgi:hypothetical protein